MKKIELATKQVNGYGSRILMEQGRQGAKVKITVIDNFGKEVIWADPDKANWFYKKRLMDGFQRV